MLRMTIFGKLSNFPTVDLGKSLILIADPLGVLGLKLFQIHQQNYRRPAAIQATRIQGWNFS